MLKSQETELRYFEQLFGSKTRVKLLRLFLVSPNPIHYYIREVCRITGEHLNSVRRELDNLDKLGLIVKEESPSGEVGQKIYYKVNKDFILFNELRTLFIKSQLLLEKSLVQGLEELGNVQLLVLTGGFTGNTNATSDLLIVGRIKTAPLAKLIKKFEKELGRDINYTVMTSAEFSYRRELTDMFLYTILEGKKVFLIDNLGISKKEKPTKKDYSRRKINVRRGK